MKLGLCVVDLNMHVGNLARAFTKCFHAVKVANFSYLGFCETETEAEFIQDSVVKQVSAQWLAGNFQVTGTQPVPETPPEGHLLELPPRPALKVLVIQEERPGVPGLVVPEAIVSSWWNHQTPHAA